MSIVRLIQIPGTERAAHIRILASMALLLLAHIHAQAALNPDEAITQYTQDVWGTNAGLPQNSVLSVAQTRDGYLWLGTEEGLARFDGVRFVVFDTGNTSALQSNQISALLVDTHGNLWIGTQGGGLTVFQDGKFKTYTVRNGLASDTILSLFADAQGVLWIGTNGGGLNCFKNGKFKTYNSKNGLSDESVFSLDGSKDGSLWIGTHSGLVRFKTGIFTTYTTKDGLSGNYVRCVRVARNGDVWIGTIEGGLSRWSNGHFTSYRSNDSVRGSAIWCLMEDDAGTLWAGTVDAGIKRFQHGQFTSYSSKNGLPANRVFAFLEDKEGGFWIGTGEGLVRLATGVFTTISMQEGLSNDQVLPVYQDHNGVIWAGTNGGGLNRIENGRITTYTTKDGLSDDTVFSIAEDREGKLWVATRHGMNRLVGKRFKLFNSRNGLPPDTVLCLYRDREGGLWAGGRGGLSRFDGDRFITFTTKDGLSSNYVVSLYEDQQSALWIGTGDGGLNALRKGRFSYYTTKNGLSNNAVWSISGDLDGVLWIATGGGGLNRFKSGKFTTYTVHQGLLDNELFQILPDRYGYLWISCNRGVFRVSKAELTAYAEGRIQSLNPVVYGRSNGLKSSECNGAFQPAGWATTDGRLIFPTMKGLAIVDPGHLKTNALTSPIVIEKLIVNGQSFDPRGPIEVKPGEGKLEISFTSPSMTNSETIRFRYKLDGFETSWTDAGTRRTAYYTNIQPGLYRFTVTSRNSDGVWNNTGATVSLTLRPHYYQTHTFMVLCAALLLALSLGVYALRMRQLKANEKRLVQVVGERTKALEEQVRAKEQAHAELAQAQQSLMDLSRRSGMAEVATGVLHNVGNVLNSVNVGASVIGNKLRESRVEQLCSAVNMLQENAHDLSGFVQANPKGQRLLPYLVKLAQHLQGERNQVLGELDGLTGHIDHIKEIVATQQDYAKASALAETVSLDKLVSQALAMVEASLSRHHVDVVVHMDDTFEITVIKHKVVEILVNLIRNAKQAVIEQDGPLRQVCVSVKRQAQDRVRIEIHDTGVGLAPENLTRIFAHGFTTKQNGHGFGLHSGALSAQQMGGSLRAESEGPGLGATFILELPATQPIVEPEMSTV